MKTQKKVLALALTLVLAFVMTLSLAVTAFADGEDAATTYKITINNDSELHTYEAYQIFAGDLSTEGTDKILSNITWGKNVDTEKVDEALDDLYEGEPEGKPTTAAEWAEWLEDNDSKAEAFAKAIAKCLKDTPATLEYKDGHHEAEVEAGYYLIKDKDKTLNGKDDTYTSFILEVVGDATANPKGDKPDVEKEVLDNNDSDVDDETNDWGKSADHDIGDDVSFRLTGTLPSNYADYNSYKYVFHDTLSKGLTYNGDAKVYAVKNGVKTEITGFFTIDPEEATEPNGSDTTITISCDDLKKITNPVLDKDYEIVVEYTAKLNDDAVIGNPGNPNKVKLEYSNNPNYEKKGTPGDDDDDDEPTGETPEKKVVVFTYEVDINKKDEGGNPLDGATFTLEKFVEDAEDAEVTGPDSYKGKTGTWTVVEVKVTESGTKFEFIGLDDGYYRLTETEAPEGYNQLAEPLYFEVKPTHDENGTELETGDIGDLEFTLTTTTKDVEGTGTLTADVINNKGSNLPSTGGIGTTIFYIIGGVLVALTSVLLITKSRMKGKN